MALGLLGTASAAVNCNSFPNSTINTFVNNDVIAVGYTCTFGPSASINGGLIQTGEGGLVIRGAVNGGVTEEGNGDVIIARGARIAGDVSEADGGSVSIRGGSSIDGAVEESGDGLVNVTVDVPGLVKGNVYENGNGGVTISALSGSFEGSVSETGPGMFKGNSEHSAPGTCANTIVNFQGTVCKLN